MSDTWVEIEVRRTKTVIVTARCTSRNTGRSHDVYMDQPSAYYAICIAHRTTQEVSKLQAETVEDSESFCKKCLAGAAPVTKKIDPYVETLRHELARAQGQLPAAPRSESDKKKWRVGKSFRGFIDGLDIDI